jgi:hypothetical protein
MIRDFKAFNDIDGRLAFLMMQCFRKVVISKPLPLLIPVILILRFAEDSLLFQGSSRTLSRIFFGLIILELGSAEKGPGEWN